MIGIALAAAAALASTDCRAIDGDTLVCRVGMERLHLRLNGIDSPELPGHCRAGRHCAPGDPVAAKANAAALIAGKRVAWRALKLDRYGRTIAQARVGRMDLSCAQLRGGFAIYRREWDTARLTRSTCPSLAK